MSQTIAQFEIAYVQHLNQHGQIKNLLPEWTNDPKTLLKLYQTMLLTRLFDKKAIALQRTGKIGTYAPIYGQEAIGTALGYAMNDDDVFIPYYRDYATQLQRGVRISELLQFWGGDERGSAYANNAEDLPICVPIASQCLHAAGIAFALQYRQEPRVAVVSIGDGGTSEGDFYEAINVAGLWNLPLVFVINNNQWAISVPLHQQTKTQTLAQKAIAAGFEGIQVDGNDIFALTQVFKECIEKARNGQGPTLIEAVSYRLSDHTTADDATRYQPKIDVEAAHLNEPLHRFKIHLEQQQILNASLHTRIEHECLALIQREVETFLQTRPQEPNTMFDYLYAKLPDDLIEQRTMLMEEAFHA